MRGRSLLVALIVLATAGFAIGVAVEKSVAEESHADETSVTEEGEASEEQSEEGEETQTVLGLNLESTPLVVAAVVASLLLAVAVWMRPRWRALLVVVALAMLAFAVLDVAEVVHQTDESRAGVAVIAAAVAILHLAAAGTAVRMLGGR